MARHLAALRRRADQLHARQGRQGGGGRPDRGADDPRRLDICARRQLARPELEARRHRSGLTSRPARCPHDRGRGLARSGDRRAGTRSCERISFSDISGWARRRSRRRVRDIPRRRARLIADAPPKTRALGIDGPGLQRVARAALGAAKPRRPNAAREFFERWFVPHRIDRARLRHRLLRAGGRGEPRRRPRASPCRSIAVPPIWSRSATQKRPAGWDPEMRFARRTEAGLAPFFDRAAIEEGALAGRGLELAWLETRSTPSSSTSRARRG